MIPHAAMVMVRSMLMPMMKVMMVEVIRMQT
jgi:hypothetical protein